MRLLALVLIVILPACANTGPVQLSPDTYIIAKQDNAGIFGNQARFKGQVIQEANEFAKSRGKVAIPLHLTETPHAPGRFGTVEYQFRVVDPNDPEARRMSLSKQPDVVIESKSRSTIDLNVQPAQTGSRDVYAELLKLDELRKKGILTDAEFEEQKKKLLNSK